MGRHRRKYTEEFKAAAVDRLYEPGATQGSVAKGFCRRLFWRARIALWPDRLILRGPRRSRTGSVRHHQVVPSGSCERPQFPRGSPAQHRKI
ncbi:transposase [Palleronia caenipelagi]|uniref:transposase n=1 Tax=Palleronia caenipelagi TaxID=2489174 RepID=UPI001FE3F1E5|nr:transposase [Palleronia caenipelagi]